MIGRVARDKAGRPQRALAFSHALQIDRDDIDLARQVGRLMVQQRKHDDLVELYHQYGVAYFQETYDEQGIREAQIAWHEAVAELQEERLLDVDGAVDTLEALISLDPQHRGALERLRRPCLSVA